MTNAAKAFEFPEANEEAAAEVAGGGDSMDAGRAGGAVGAAALGVGLLAEVADDVEGCFAATGAAGADFGESKGGAVGVAAFGLIDRVGGGSCDGVGIGFAVDGVEADAAAVDADLEIVFAAGVES